MTMDERSERVWLHAAVCALLLGCSGPTPEAPARDGAVDLSAAETSTPVDGASSPDVVDASAPNDRGDDVAADVTAPIDVSPATDASLATDAADVTTPIDLGADAALDDARAPADSGADAAPSDAAAPSAAFTMLFESVFRPRCAISGCHVEGSSATRLVMTDAASTYARLVNVRDQCMFNTGGRVRVVPFDPSMSAIMLFREDGLCGRRHGVILPGSYDFEQQVADLQRFREWIMAGAR